MEYDCEIVDTAGQDEFSLFPPKYAVGVHGYMLVYSIASRQSFDMITTLHEKILDQSGQERVPCVVVGQKSDLASDRRVTTAEGEALAKKLGAAFIESSARDNQNVGEYRSGWTMRLSVRPDCFLLLRHWEPTKLTLLRPRIRRSPCRDAARVQSRAGEEEVGMVAVQLDGGRAGCGASLCLTNPSFLINAFPRFCHPTTPSHPHV